MDSNSGSSIEERLHRRETIQQVFEEGEWLTRQELDALQRPVGNWKRQGRVFSVELDGLEYFPRYEFDATLCPLPVIREILSAFGEVADTWTLAAWLHYPSAWLVARDEQGVRNVAPKDCLSRPVEVIAAATKRGGSYVA